MATKSEVIDNVRTKKSSELEDDLLEKLRLAGLKHNCELITSSRAVDPNEKYRFMDSDGRFFEITAMRARFGIWPEPGDEAYLPMSTGLSQKASPGTFDYLLQLLPPQSNATNEQRGRLFEHMCRYFLQTDPVYRNECDRVEFLKAGARGLDLAFFPKPMAGQANAKPWGVQAKLYLNSRVDYAAVAPMITEVISTQSEEYSRLVLIAATNNFTANALEALRKANAIKIDLETLRQSPIQWPTTIEQLVAGDAIHQSIRVQPLEYQEKARDDVVAGLEKAERGQLIMPPGTGKTNVALWAAEKLNSRIVLFAAPSLALIKQSLNRWAAQAAEGKSFRALVVCSDEDSARVERQNRTGLLRNREAQDKADDIQDAGVPVESDPSKIGDFLRAAHDSADRHYVFSTYHSLEKITQAQEILGASTHTFDLAIIDEAHNTAGNEIKEFSRVLEQNLIRANKRLFMTATPRTFRHRGRIVNDLDDVDIVSMDNSDLYGEVLHRLPLGEAVQNGYLAQYRVVIVGVSDEEIRNAAIYRYLIKLKGEKDAVTDMATLAARVAVAKAMHKYDIKRIITSHRSVSSAREFVDPGHPVSLPAVIEKMQGTEKPSRPVSASYVSGRMPMYERVRILDRLADDGHEAQVVANCKVLNEGIDVPEVDGIAFVDPKRSEVDIVQLIGRALRRIYGAATDPKDKTATIVIPVFMNESQATDEQRLVDANGFDTVMEVLRALRAHDETFATHIDAIRSQLGKRRVPGLSNMSVLGRMPSGGTIEYMGAAYSRFDLSRIEQCISVRTINEVAIRPLLTLSEIKEMAREHQADGKKKFPNAASEFRSSRWSGETWAAIDQALRGGKRGLGKDPEYVLWKSSLPENVLPSLALLNPDQKAVLSLVVIREMIGEHLTHSPEFPGTNSRFVSGRWPRESWEKIDNALRHGFRGLDSDPEYLEWKATLPQGDVPTLAAMNPLKKLDLTLAKIIEVAEEYQESNEGEFPSINSSYDSSVLPGESWTSIDQALKGESRGLANDPEYWKWKATLPAGKSPSLFMLNPGRKIDLTMTLIRELIEEHRGIYGGFPKKTDQMTSDRLPGETWRAIDHALTRGLRGLPRDPEYGAWKSGLSQGVMPSLALLDSERKADFLTFQDVQEMITDHQVSHKEFPNAYRDFTGEKWPGESWKAIDLALRFGRRGLDKDPEYIEWKANLPDGEVPRLSLLNADKKIKFQLAVIREMIDVRCADGERFPTSASGLVGERWKEETWSGVDQALRTGGRSLKKDPEYIEWKAGLPAGVKPSLSALNPDRKPQIGMSTILEMVCAHRQLTDKLPSQVSAFVSDNWPNETWTAIDRVLAQGGRGIDGDVEYQQWVAQLPPGIAPSLSVFNKTYAHLKLAESQPTPQESESEVDQSDDEIPRG